MTHIIDNISTIIKKHIVKHHNLYNKSQTNYQIKLFVRDLNVKKVHLHKDTYFETRKNTWYDFLCCKKSYIEFSEKKGELLFDVYTFNIDLPENRSYTDITIEDITKEHIQEFLVIKPVNQKNTHKFYMLSGDIVIDDDVLHAIKYNTATYLNNVFKDNFIYFNYGEEFVTIIPNHNYTFGVLPNGIVNIHK